MFIHKEKTALCIALHRWVDAFVRTLQVPSPALHILGPLHCAARAMCSSGSFWKFHGPQAHNRQHVENAVWGQNHMPKTVRFGLIPECLHSSSPDLLLHKLPKLRKLSSSSFILCFWVPFWAGLCWKPWKKSLEKARQMTDLD